MSQLETFVDLSRFWRSYFLHSTSLKLPESLLWNLAEQELQYKLCFLLLNSGKIGGRRGTFKANEACRNLFGFHFRPYFVKGVVVCTVSLNRAWIAPSLMLWWPEWVFLDQSSSRLHSDILFFLYHVVEAMRPNLHQPLSSSSQVWMSMVFLGRRPFVEAWPQRNGIFFGMLLLACNKTVDASQAYHCPNDRILENIQGHQLMKAQWFGVPAHLPTSVQNNKQEQSTAINTHNTQHIQCATNTICTHELLLHWNSRNKQQEEEEEE